MKRLIPPLVFLLMVSCTGEMDGIISVKGNEPHTYLAFTTDNGDVYRIEGPKVIELHDKYQGTRVRIKGKLIRKKETTSFSPGIIDLEKVVKVYTK